MSFRFELWFDELPPDEWLHSFLDGRHLRVEVGQQLFDGHYFITDMEIHFQDVNPRFKTHMKLMKVGPL